MGPHLAPVLIFALLAQQSRGGSPWDPSFAALAEKAASVMTLAEKVSLLQGHSILDVPYVGNVPALNLSSRGSVDLPPLHLEDGPQGVADAVSFVTAFPSAATVAMTWDVELAQAFGAAMAAEQAAKGTNIALAPAVNLVRVPWAGRVWEYLGEDPTLAAAIAAAEVRGIQTGTNISGCVKHFILNAQEFDRQSVSETASRRTLWELYYKPFQAAVDAGVGSAMCSYNRVSNVYACENAIGLHDLKSRMGFKGFVMSDWYATHSLVDAVTAGLDQEMPIGIYYGWLESAISAGELTEAEIDAMVVRVLTPVFALGLVGNPPPPSHNVFANATSDAHNRLALKLAESSITLLKNEGALLPLRAQGISTIAVFGDRDTVVGVGSGGVTLPYVVTPSDGISRALAEMGMQTRVVYNDGTNLTAALQLASEADVCVVVVAITSAEGTDRVNLNLPAEQDALVSIVAAANARTIAVMRCPGACLMPWAANVSAILYELMPGQESGNSIARTIFGLNNPSGKLPLSFPSSMQDTWLGAPNATSYPGIQKNNSWLEVTYSEGLQMGYRWYDTQGTSPLWSFGHGLSYSSFAYGELTVSGALSSTNLTSSVNVTFPLSLSPGSPDGAEVVQLYVSFPPSLGEPPRVLRAFKKVALSSAAPTADVVLTLTAVDCAVWDEGVDDWVVHAGAYNVSVGGGSRDLRVFGSLSVQ